MRNVFVCGLLCRISVVEGCVESLQSLLLFSFNLLLHSLLLTLLLLILLLPLLL